MGMCCRKGLVFHKKSLDIGPIFLFQTNPWKWVPFHEKLQKVSKISHFKGWNPLKMGFLSCEKFVKKNSKISHLSCEKKQWNLPLNLWKNSKINHLICVEKMVKSVIFWGRKSSDMGRGFRPHSAHPHQTPPPTCCLLYASFWVCWVGPHPE